MTGRRVLGIGLDPTRSTSKTERVVESLARTSNSSDDSGAAQVIDSTGERRGSSEAEQLIRNQ
jgi:hypothetical protein